MNENGYDSNQLYNNEYDQQYSLQQYEQIVARESRAFIRPLYAIAAMLMLFIGLFALKLDSAIFAFFIGVMCIFMGIGIITDKRNSFKEHTKTCVWVIFGIEAILASGYQILTRYIPSLQAMNGRVIGMVSGIIIGGVGPLLLIFHFLNYYIRKKTCTQEVQAVCVYLQRRWFSGSYDDSNIKFIPIYEFSFRGKKCCVAGSYKNQITVSSAGKYGTEVKYYNVPTIGTQYDLMINPDDPADFYLKKDKPCISVWIIAFIAIAIGCFLFKSTLG